MENLSRLVTNKEIESIIKTSQQTQFQDQMASLVNDTIWRINTDSFQTLKLEE